MLGVILAGGKGTRLRPFTMNIPKPLLPLGDTPIVDVVIRQMAAAGIKRIVLALGHMGPLFTAVLGDGSRWGVELEYCLEDEPLGTAGVLRLIQEPTDDLLVMNGDILTTLDYQTLFFTHRRLNSWATIALTHREVQIDYGVVVAENGYLQDYKEKPSLQYEVSMGINVLSHRCIELIPAGRKFDMPDLLLAVRRAGKPVACHRTDCYWKDIGLFEDYQKASADFVEDPAKFLPSRESKQCASR
jgi:NDP-sugar pyrophosphorylase family protein